MLWVSVHVSWVGFFFGGGRGVVVGFFLGGGLGVFFGGVFYVSVDIYFRPTDGVYQKLLRTRSLGC